MNYKQKPNRIPLAIQFRHMPNLETIRQMVVQQLESLASLVTPGARCEVVLDKGHPSGNGGVYEISVRFRVPRERIYVTHVSDSCSSLDTLYGVIAAAFEDIKRQMVRSHARRFRQLQTLEAA